MPNKLLSLADFGRVPNPSYLHYLLRSLTFQLGELDKSGRGATTPKSTNREGEGREAIPGGGGALLQPLQGYYPVLRPKPTRESRGAQKLRGSTHLLHLQGAHFGGK